LLSKSSAYQRQAEANEHAAGRGFGDRDRYRRRAHVCVPTAKHRVEVIDADKPVAVEVA
jgi:hypothetical protein